MQLLITSFLAGMLSVLAPCVVAILPVILGKSVSNGSQPKRRAWIIIGSLLLSIFVFSLILKASTLLIDVPQSYWQVISGAIIFAYGIVTLFPSAWEHIAQRLKLQQKASAGSAKAMRKGGVGGDIALGASLGPIFSACSPTYALIIAGILPVSLGLGLIYLTAFLAGLGLMLLLVALLGQKFVKKMRWSINPNGWFKRALAVLFIITGLVIMTGFDKTIETYFVQNGYFDWQVNLESRLQQ